MPLPTQPYKGARDFYPEDKRQQKYIFNKLRKVVEKFGYEEYDAPILEPVELYLAKSGSELVNEQTYTFTDRGDRQVAIRPEMTPTVSRLVAARRQELAYPLRWYSIPNLWRYERPQRGRLREHWQLNVDIFGVETIAAEHELILVIDEIFRAFKAKRSMYQIKISSRSLITYIFETHFGLNPTETIGLFRLIDRMHKMDYAEFSVQLDMLLTPSQREINLSENILNLLKIKNFHELPEDLKEQDGFKKLAGLFSLLDKSSVTNVEFDITLMRGFDYYTDIVFEVVNTHPENNRSMFGGGRYDGLVGLFGVEPVPTVGFGMGDVTLKDFLEVHELMPKIKSELDAVIILVGDVYDKAQDTIAELREMGLNIAVDSSGAKLDKQLRMADKRGARYVIFIGEQELTSEQFKLKNLSDSTEATHGLQRIVSIVKDFRNN